MTRRFAIAAVAAALAVLSVPFGTSPPAGAMTRATMRVTIDKPAVASYGPILAGWFPGSAALNWYPSGCKGPGTAQGQAVCDTVPIEMVPPPGIGPNDMWWVDIEVSWANTTPINDLDIYLWDDGQVDRRDNADAPFAEFGQSAGTDNPEKIRAILPTLGLYNLTVVNYTGVHLQYTVKATMTVGERFVDPFELLEDIPAAPAGDAPAPIDTPADLSGLENFGDEPADFSALEDLTGGDLESSGIDELSAGISDLPAPPPAPAVGNIANVRPGPASGVLMFLWMVLVPAAIVGGTWTFILARSRRTLAGL